MTSVCALRLAPGQQLDRYGSRSKMVLAPLDNIDKMPAEKVVATHAVVAAAMPSSAMPSGASPSGAVPSTIGAGDLASASP